MLLRPDNTVIKLKLEGHVPVINESCKQVSRETADYEGLRAMAARLVHEADLLPVMASHKKAPPATEQEEDDGIEEHGDEETRAAVKCRTVDELMAEATSLEHQFKPEEPVLPDLHKSPHDEAACKGKGWPGTSADKEVRRPCDRRPCAHQEKCRGRLERGGRSTSRQGSPHAVSMRVSGNIEELR